MKPFEKIMKRPALPNYYRRRIAPYCPPCAGSRGRSCAAERLLLPFDACHSLISLLQRAVRANRSYSAG